jgi:hypothetical protein
MSLNTLSKSFVRGFNGSKYSPIKSVLLRLEKLILHYFSLLSRVYKKSDSATAPDIFGLAEVSSVPV